MRAIELPQGLVGDLRGIGLAPTDIVLYINAGCNLRCSHCYVGTPLLDSGVYYSASSIAAFVAELPALDRVTILGGEPFVHPSCAEIVQRFGDHPCGERRMTTNLTMWSADILEAVKAARFRLCVSVDGHDAPTHDRVRGAGAFDKTVSNLVRVVREGHDVEVTHTVTAENIEYFVDVLELCRTLGVKRLNLHRVSLRGNALRNRHLDVSATEWRALVDGLAAMPGQGEGSVGVRYEVGFATEAEFEELVSSGQYRHHASASYYSPSGGHRIVIFPDQRIYISSEAFGTNSHIGDIANGRFAYNITPDNELLASAEAGFYTTSINREIRGDLNYPIPLSVSFRRTAQV